MCIIIIPGIHEPELTQSFISGWLESASDSSKKQKPVDILVFPSSSFLPLSGLHIVQFLYQNLARESPVVFISFSAGVVGAIQAAWLWQLCGGNVKKFIAIDGWGVPLWGNFPIHRMSHDYFTHWSSVLFGGGQNFYADPPVEHLFMWRSPQTVQGWCIESSIVEQYITAAEFLHKLI
ncbi:hypothetical protein [Iningainema tapete]|uniref:Uncharacterized protein n=1 Tax=Iningainema tapete BLCC-T55 TaxID=2748662 RepID=A0A8J6XBB1_9CYAN|nr:hypothetical protein [Iningainema tapete]MBD2771995.1 hypothetical protein [Iningainema tapete BLCC-T55]